MHSYRDAKTEAAFLFLDFNRNAILHASEKYAIKICILMNAFSLQIIWLYSCHEATVALRSTRSGEG